MKKGRLISVGWANITPTKSGLIAAPSVLATPVTPPAADRSSAVTTAIVYDCLAGTSIWLMLNRTSKTAIAVRNVGISGTMIRRTFDGKWVATMVVIRPNRDARRAAT